jgi:hypothetical protein
MVALATDLLLTRAKLEYAEKNSFGGATGWILCPSRCKCSSLKPTDQPTANEQTACGYTANAARTDTERTTHPAQRLPELGIAPSRRFSIERTSCAGYGQKRLRSRTSAMADSQRGRSRLLSSAARWPRHVGSAVHLIGHTALFSDGGR